MAPEQLLCQGCGQGSAGAGQGPTSVWAHCCGEREVFLEAMWAEFGEPGELQGCTGTWVKNRSFVS